MNSSQHFTRMGVGDNRQPAVSLRVFFVTQVLEVTCYLRLKLGVWEAHWKCVSFL